MLRRFPAFLPVLPLLLTGALLSGCGIGSAGDRAATVPDGGTGNAQAMSAGERSWALRILQLVNDERTSWGLAPFAWDEKAAAAAYRQAYDMDARDFFAHVNPDGEYPGDRLHDQGITWISCGENLAMGYSSPEEVFDAWLTSPAHRLNLFDPNFKYCGIGIHTSHEGGPWWVQDFYR